ncbi:MAG TPA: hypothetical protein VFV41_27395 [Streptosporangiaceae bacterium]|nr:hypothetical protein [Streptosporangiaceae bacterium]
MADAVVIPGAMFGPAAGMLMYAAAVAQRLGLTVHRHWWSQQPPDPFQPDVEAWVRKEISPLLDAVPGSPLLIAKSLGTNAASLAAERGLPGVWLTPILSAPWVAAALSHATAPFLLVGGTADDMWDGILARQLTPHVLEIRNADHGMHVPGPLTGSIAVLGQVITTMQKFLDGIERPN